MGATNAIFYIAILIMSVVIHEISHGFVAEYFGDDTARKAGRLTLNPLKHLDPFGSIILPALMYFSTGFVFGWAKPVPYNPYNLSNKKWGTVAVASAGILANLFLAVIFGLLLRFSPGWNLPAGFVFITSSIVITNLALAIFNLLPIPPLDGSKILFSLFPESLSPFLALFEQYSFFLLLIFIFFFSDSLRPILGFLYSLITGIIF
jgi:Zn-dependent protease